ncbi:damage-inducible protein DinB [Rhizobium sp. KVB221]|uniref:Damage-inducible protein DinB n=1 Tax=Rhizobium setariae TaxID=2801340 RepID=A0A936YR36_9HYPH|nr:DinB family protein [Rhizobium setariae]MBL0371251.1 damage-inducible protein DinB [Rhizobium setariae]
MKSTLQMFAAYNAWANRVIYAAAKDLTAEELTQNKGAFFGSLIGTLNHLLAADRIWLKRITGTGEAPAALNTMLYPELADLTGARIKEDERIIALIDSLDDAVFEGNFTYTPITTPEPVTQRLASALFHIFNHQTHHRGQCHMILTALGKPSVTLDMVYFQRTAGKRWI